MLRKDLPETEYRLADRDGRRVLRAAASGGGSGLRCQLHADPRERPFLRWDWLVDSVPSTMCVNDGEADDSPARLVIGFDGDHASLPAKDRALFEFVELVTGHRLPFATLMYVWDGRLPVGTIVHNRRTSRIRYLVVESGAAACGRWLGYRRNLAEDVQRVFAEQAGPITSVGVLTDSDDTKLEVRSWYGDILLES